VLRVLHRAAEASVWPRLLPVRTDSALTVGPQGGCWVPHLFSISPSSWRAQTLPAPKYTAGPRWASLPTLPVARGHPRAADAPRVHRAGARGTPTHHTRRETAAEGSGERRRGKEGRDTVRALAHAGGPPRWQVRSAVPAELFEARSAASKVSLEELASRSGAELPIFFMYPGTKVRTHTRPSLCVALLLLCWAALTRVVYTPSTQVGERVALHFFEPRYKVMIRRAWEGNRQFIFCSEVRNAPSVSDQH
jgi:hypothetical protein